MTQEKQDETRPDLEHGKLPDPEAKAISCLFDQIKELEKKYAALSVEHEAFKKRLETGQH
jgi:serine O-acetyltransferase